MFRSDSLARAMTERLRTVSTEHNDELQRQRNTAADAAKEQAHKIRAEAKQTSWTKVAAAQRERDAAKAVATAAQSQVERAVESLRYWRGKAEAEMLAVATSSSYRQ